MSIVRQNLLSRPRYAPYCGNPENCNYNLPRTTWNPEKEQFQCRCGWVSGFPKEFIAEYKEFRKTFEEK